MKKLGTPRDAFVLSGTWEHVLSREAFFMMREKHTLNILVRIMTISALIVIENCKLIDENDEIKMAQVFYLPPQLAGRYQEFGQIDHKDGRNQGFGC